VIWNRIFRLFLTGLVLVCGLVAVLPAVRAGQFGAGTPAWLSLAEAKRLALEHNWDLLAAKSGVDAATAQLLISKEFPNPTASLSTARIGTRENATAQGNGLWNRNYDTIAAVSQLIEIAGKRSARQQAARAGMLSAGARFLDAKRVLEQGVTKAYLAALLALENARIYRESSGYLHHESEMAGVRFRAGDLSQADKIQIEISAAQYETQTKAAEAAGVQTRIALEILLGVEHPLGNWIPADSLTNGLALSMPAGDAVDGGLRPDALAAEADLRAARAQLRLQQALRVPDPTISLGYEHNPPGGGPPVDTLMLGVSFPLPLWNQNGGSIKAARTVVDQAELALGKIRTQVAAERSSAEVAYNEAYARWLRYRDDLAPQSAKVRATVAFAFQRGGRSMVELLEAQRMDNDIRLAAAQSLADAASAVADLQAARKLSSEAAVNQIK
jgi:cobalt-zinc-cadmium efflux system outer membrane protein